MQKWMTRAFVTSSLDSMSRTQPWNRKLWNSLWPSVAIQQNRAWSTWVQLMAWCLVALSHFPSKFWLSSVRSCDIRVKAITWKYSRYQSPNYVWKWNIKNQSLGNEWNQILGNERNQSLGNEWNQSLGNEWNQSLGNECNQSLGNEWNQSLGNEWNQSIRNEWNQSLRNELILFPTLSLGDFGTMGTPTCRPVRDR